jgi:adenylate cyclase
MQGGQPNRRLTTILAADVAGYSRLTSSDEEETLARLRSHRDTIIDPAINQHRGRIANTAGDSVLAEFPSVVEAVRCAAEIQRQIAATDQNSKRGTEPDQRVDWRIGINLGDVVEHAGDLLGDGVNIAARIEALAEPGGICLSDDVYRQVRGKIDEIFIDLGEQSLKNIPDPVHVYGVEIDTGERALKVVLREDPLVQRPAVAVLPFANLGGDAEQEYFVDGLTEEIITALSLWRSFPVVARNSTFAFKGTSLDAREIGKRLGARYILQGSVRRGGNRIRVTAQLADAISGHQVWA